MTAVHRRLWGRALFLFIVYAQIAIWAHVNSGPSTINFHPQPEQLSAVSR